MIYLATPYTDKDHDVMERRFNTACIAAGKLMLAGNVVFSPIAHTHPIAVRCELPREWDFWKKYDTEMIAASKYLIVLKMPGWEKSRGVKAEIEIARNLGIPVQYVSLTDLGIE